MARAAHGWIRCDRTARRRHQVGAAGASWSCRVCRRLLGELRGAKAARGGTSSGTQAVARNRLVQVEPNRSAPSVACSDRRHPDPPCVVGTRPVASSRLPGRGQLQHRHHHATCLRHDRRGVRRWVQRSDPDRSSGVFGGGHRRGVSAPLRRALDGRRRCNGHTCNSEHGRPRGRPHGDRSRDGASRRQDRKARRHDQGRHRAAGPGRDRSDLVGKRPGRATE